MSSTMTVTQTRAAAAPSAAAAAASPSAPQPIPTVASTTLTPTVMRIDDDWYDLTHWKKSHPGGVLILEQMHGNDATDAFYSLHSEEAIARLKRLPHSSTLPAVLAGRAPPVPTQAAVNFRKLRAELAADGYFKRNLAWDLFYAVSVYVICGFGTWLAFNGWPIMASLVIGVGMQQAGWIGHDFIHGRGKLCSILGFVCSAPINAFSRAWWSNKHNTHHVFTNYIGVDADIENDPVFHLFFPDPKDDTIFRKMQHWYFAPVASLLYVSWRSQSMQHAVASRNWLELALFAVNYVWLYQLGWAVSLGAIYFGGALVAIIVTATHQSEEMIDPACPSASATYEGQITGAAPLPDSYSFAEGQFATTRDAVTSDFFTEWLWGGMQYQLEHHLFPTAPKYYYAALAKRIERFAKENGLSYRAESQTEILLRNFKTLRHFAGTPTEKSKAQ